LGWWIWVEKFGEREGVAEDKNTRKEEEEV
jgi:hypothetical protein